MKRRHSVKTSILASSGVNHSIESIKLTTILGNYMKSLTDNLVAMAWTKHQPYYSMGIMAPVKFYN